MVILAKDGRVLKGKFHCTDNALNIILEKCDEYQSIDQLGDSKKKRKHSILIVPERYIDQVMSDSLTAPINSLNTPSGDMFQRSVRSSISESDFSSWTDKLSSHEIFNSLKYSILPTTSESQCAPSILNLTASCKGILLLWFPSKREINAVSLVTIDILSPPNWPILRLSPEPQTTIIQLILSPDGSLCILVSKDSAYLLSLPKFIYDARTYSHHLTKPLSTTIRCNQIQVYTDKPRGRKVDIKEVHFSPVELSAMLIFTLCSDGYLRIFSPTDTLEPLSMYNLNPNPNSGISTTISLSHAMGDEPVSFDFTIPSSGKTPGGQWLSLYLLLGNGDVHFISMDLSQIDMGRGDGITYSDALPIHPSPPESYEDEPCKIACLRSAVPSFVIVTAPGKLYHCVHLNTPPTQTSTSLPEKSPDDIIFLLEVVDLNPEDKSTKNTVNIFTNPPYIITDPNSAYRYILYCENGVYNVSLPSLELMNAYCKQDELGYDLSLLSQNDSMSSIEVELLLHTESNQLYGLILVSLVTLGPPVLLFTFKDGNSLSKHLPPINRIATMPLAANTSLASSISQRVQLTDSIKITLKSADPLPILKNQPHEDVTQEELYSLLINSTDLLRQQVKLAQYKALDEVLHKADSLLNSKRALENAISLTRNDLHSLKVNSKEIQDKISLAHAKYASNLDRVHRVMQQLLQLNPSLSKEEKKYQETLRELDNKIPLLNNRILQIRNKVDNPNFIGANRRKSSSRMVGRTQFDQIQSKLLTFGHSHKDAKRKLEQLHIDISTIS
ncbi:Nuclear pore complex protein Nup88 [Oopsacas minuta]|uniref:Nuclear pore complex protein Nup88 n=1 Tax=Oopsacas minuta TaxID=111878 RepID=A0AAV7JRY4_9METZ|nr:Nuclear pore complex protein Nup88 [Oopsacas minuta]